MRITVDTFHSDPARIARSIRPDHTEDVRTRIDGEHVVTTIEREAIGSAHATLDDYLVNLQVARRTEIETMTTTDTTPRDNE